MAWKSTEVFVAKHDFTATREDEVSLRAGDVVEVAGRSGDWWSGLVSGTSGVFPACFVHQMNSIGRCKVIFPFTPRQEDEVELVVGEEVEIFEEMDTWAKGRVGNRVGWFPLNYVKQDPSGNEIAVLEAATPVQLRRSTNSKARAGVRRKARTCLRASASQETASIAGSGAQFAGGHRINIIDDSRTEF